ncbi:MAG: hypothetical protein R3261_10635 [Alphaproteobacteria bacterium]|nr:hypothetical protein [Alphaproteobacteria bacterium]
MSENAVEVRFVVWQFVRLMVRLEEVVEAGGAVSNVEKSLYESWEDLWVDLDAKLIDLGKRDPEAFAELMMDQDVVTELTPEEAGAVANILKQVVQSLSDQLKVTDNEDDVLDLSFERDELSTFIQDLNDLASRK